MHCAMDHVGLDSAIRQEWNEYRQCLCGMAGCLQHETDAIRGFANEACSSITHIEHQQMMSQRSTAVESLVPYDLDTFRGRFQYFFHVSTNPLNLLHSEADIASCQQTLQRYNNGDTSKSLEELWHCTKVVRSSCHPDTGEPIHVLFRRCAFIPTNLGIFWGMLFTRHTLPFLFGWQALNQSYTCCVNLGNRNKSNNLTNKEIVTCFGAATGNPQPLTRSFL